METAKLFAKLSFCSRLQVGAVISKDDRILATGYNGTFSGSDNNCEEAVIRPTTCPACSGRGYILDSEGASVKTTCPICNGERVIKTEQIITFEEVIHAEQNVITFCARNGIPTNNTTMYITHSPCITCAKLIIQSGISKVIYEKDYKCLEGVELLRNNKVTVYKI